MVLAILHCQGKHRLGAARICPNAERTQHRSSDTPFSATFDHFTLHLLFLEHTQFRECATSLIFEKGVDAQIGLLNTQALVEHEIEDFRKNTNPLLRQPRQCRHSGARNHLSLSAPLIATPHPLPPLFLELPEAFHRHCVPGKCASHNRQSSK